MCIGIICLVAVAFSGCVGTDQNKLASATTPPTPIQTPIPVGQYVFTEEQNGATVYLNLTNTITLKLKENPSTGYSWALTTTNGLKGTGDFFVSSDTTGRLSGAGGTHWCGRHSLLEHDRSRDRGTEDLRSLPALVGTVDRKRDTV
ncbi:MAG: protease inhibitor I42 family protein [Methanoregula sp.]|nr:protease inhibitor I42 family protein [Methanoregula sp.]